MGKHKWPRPPEVIESSDGMVTTLRAHGNPTGITFWSYRVDGPTGGFAGQGTALSRVGARFGAWSVRRMFRSNR